MKNILVCCTGSVATIKLPELVDELKLQNFKLKVVLTKAAEHFCDKDVIQAKEVEVYTDESEWSLWEKRGDPVLHIDLGKWADAIVIAPLDANTLAKISQGICDNLLTCIVRAWDTADPKKSLFFCPAMNTRMLLHPITDTQISQLQSWGYMHISSITKTLMCGDTGPGAMALIDTIVKELSIWASMG